MTVPFDPQHPDAGILARAADALRRGELVAFPTETVYGLGAHALDDAAVARIFAAKGRPAYNPLIVHVADVAAARALAADWPPMAQALAERFWPGPLTLVVPRGPGIPDRVTAGRDSVALRIPDHPVALALLRACGVPLAAPSANRFTELSPTTAQHVARTLGHRVAMVLDGGPTQVGIESTVVDCTGPQAVLLRPGMISREQLAAVVGPVGDPAPPEAADAPRAAPGMIERHYAPRAQLVLVDAAALDTALAAAEREAAAGAVIGALLRSPRSPAIALVSVLPDDPAGYARRLYAELHACDDRGCVRVLVERPPSGAAWDGVRDRLARAAHPGDAAAPAPGHPGAAPTGDAD